MRLAAIIGFLGIILCCLNSLAEDTIKIGYVDINRVFEAYDKAKGITSLIKQEKEKGKQERARREEEIRKSSKELQEKESSLSEKGKEKERQEVEKKIQELVKFDRVQREKEYEPVRKALGEIYQTVEKIGKREEFDLIIEKRKSLFGKTIIFGKKSLDLTDKIIKELLKKDVKPQ